MQEQEKGYLQIAHTSKPRTLTTLGIFASRLGIAGEWSTVCINDLFNEGNMEDWYGDIVADLTKIHGETVAKEIVVDVWLDAWLHGNERPLVDFKTAREALAHMSLHFLEEIETAKAIGYTEVSWHLLRHGRRGDKGLITPEGAREIGMYCDIEYEGIDISDPKPLVKENILVTHGPSLAALFYFLGQKLNKNLLQTLSGEIFQDGKIETREYNGKKYEVYIPNQLNFLSYANLRWQLNDYSNPSRSNVSDEIQLSSPGIKENFSLNVFEEFIRDYLEVEADYQRYASQSPI